MIVVYVVNSGRATRYSGKNQPAAPSRDGVKAASTHTPRRKTGLPITLNHFKGSFVIFETLTS